MLSLSAGILGATDLPQPPCELSAISGATNIPGKDQIKKCTSSET